MSFWSPHPLGVRLVKLGGEVKAGGGAGGVAPVLNHWLLDLLGVSPGLGADLLGNIDTFLDFLKKSNNKVIQ